MSEKRERRAADYRAQAESARSEAGLVSNDRVRQQLLAMAEGYDALAEAVDVIERQRRNLWRWEDLA